MNVRYLTRCIALCLAVLVLIGCTTPAEFTDAPQTQIETSYALEFSPGQTFLAHHAGLKAIEVYLTPADAENGSVTLHLRANPLAERDLANATVRLRNVEEPGFYRFSFDPLENSHGQLYYFFLTGTGVTVGGSQHDSYPEGTAYRDRQPGRQDLALRLVYDTPSIVMDLLTFVGTLGVNAIAGMFLYVIPGLAFIVWLWPGDRVSWLEYAGLGAGLSIAIYPLVLLWLHAAGISAGPLVAVLPGGIGLFVLLWRARNRVDVVRQDIRTRRVTDSAPDLILVFILGIMLVTRLFPIRTMVAPAWGDSFQHTIIVQLLLDNGGLFHSWQPYAPMQTFTYHYGYHAAVAAWAWLTGTSAPQAVLSASQMLNVLAVFALYPLAVRLTGGNRWAGVGAVLVAGLLSSMPAFYVNWGRYTQLAGQIILPTVLWCLTVWWAQNDRPSPRILGLLLVLLAGLALTHYRILILAAAAVVAWGGWSLWRLRDTPREWAARVTLFGAVSAVAMITILPWGINVYGGRLAAVHTNVVQTSVDTPSFWQDLRIWRTTIQHYSVPMLVSCVASVILALWKRRQTLGVVAIWCVLVFLTTNPFVLRLPGTGLITNFTLIIALYFPIALFLGWALGVIWEWFAAQNYGLPLIAGMVLLASVVGIRQQFGIVDPFFQMMTPADRVAFEWIKDNTPENATFLVNGFLAFSDTALVGSDAGWWLPFYTLRNNTIPPLPYMFERMPRPDQREEIRHLGIRVRASGGSPDELRAALCGSDVTHVYLGQRRGRVGMGATPLIKETWLHDMSAFTLVYQLNQVQIWSFDRTICE